MPLREYEIICPKCDQEFPLLVDHTEVANAKRESGTTGCSAAGGGIKQCKPNRSAGREPCLTDAIASVHDRRAYYFNLSNMKDGERYTIIVKEYDCLLRELNRIEARRRNAGCV